MRRAVTLVLAVWAVGIFLAEGVQQAGAGAAVLLALALLFRQSLRLAPDVRAYAMATLALAAWQLLSPALALMTGAAERWPRSARYGQVLDTVAGAAVASIGTVGVPWLLLGGLVAGGWLVACALGLFQHFVLWAWEPPALLKLNLSRIQENFGTDRQPRYAAGGFLFHRLRFSHGAIAILGPALAVLARGKVPWRRVLAGAVVGALLLVPFTAFARAALLTGFLVCVLAVLLLSQGTARKVGLAAAAVLAVLVAVTPAWRERLGKAAENLLGGERTLAMSVGWRLVREHPLLGVGFGNHKPAALATQAQTGITDLLATDAHNLWLTAWAETGLVGMALLASVHLLLLRALVRRHRAGSLAATGALLSFGGFHLLSLVHYLPFHSSVHLTFAYIWGLGLCHGSELLGARDDTGNTGEKRFSFLGMSILPTRRQRRRALGQGMTEVVIIVFLVGIGAIGLVGLFGDNIRGLFGGSAAALSGNADVANTGRETNRTKWNLRGGTLSAYNPGGTSDRPAPAPPPGGGGFNPGGSGDNANSPPQ